MKRLISNMLFVIILRLCFPFTDVLSVCTDVEFNVCGICVRLSTFTEEPAKQVNIALPEHLCHDSVETASFLNPSLAQRTWCPSKRYRLQFSQVMTF
jgi:hypothetical protein